MKRIKISIHPVFLALLLFLYTSLPGAAEILEGRVVGVHDGDTVTLLIAGNQQVKIRLAQIFSRSTRQFVHNNRMTSYVHLIRPHDDILKSKFYTNVKTNLRLH